ncbi:hypothetical protein P0D72_07815 [Paraburkholderia sediminicola]|uniref:hypothetical protein n=1 Tax=Paraburkholderia sediminicola TaxID=458836 RepID=UPI0038BD8450
MKTAWLLLGGLLCASSWQANAAATIADSSTETPDASLTSMGSQPSAGTMSGGPAVSLDKTRAQVYQELLQAQHNGQAARIQEVFKGGN